MWHPGMNSNMNFPTPLSFLGLAGALFGTVIAAVVIATLLYAHKKKAARLITAITIAGGIVYLGLLFGFSIGSRQKVVARGQEKYFCEMDCHLAYSIVGVKQEPAAGGATRYLVSVRTRFDETTISARRPKDAPLVPSPRVVELVDSAGHSYAAESSSGTSLMQPLIPGESYTTELKFTAPVGAHDLKLLVQTIPGFPDQFVIGDENSWLHKKTYLAL